MITLTPPTIEEMTASILAHYYAASEVEHFEGSHWYDSARLLASDYAERYNVTLEQAACVIAAHSVNARWSINIRRAEAQLAGQPVGLTKSIAMAAATMNDAENPFQHITGPKINPFAHNIAGDEQMVATDRWAQRAAGVEQFIGRKGVREDLIDAYRKAAAEVGVTPAVMQAIVWVHIRGSAS